MTASSPTPEESSLLRVEPALYLLCAFSACMGLGFALAGSFAGEVALWTGLAHFLYAAALAWAIRNVYRGAASARLQILCLMWIAVVFEGYLIVGNLRSERLLMLLLISLHALVPAGGVILVLHREASKPGPRQGR